MMGLVLISQASDDDDGVFFCGLVDIDGHETPLKGCVLPDVTAIFVYGDGPDHLQVSPGQDGF